MYKCGSGGGGGGGGGGPLHIGYCTWCLPADWFLCCAAEESTKYVIWLSAQAQEIKNGYLMNWLEFNISLQHVHVWEEEMDVEDKFCCEMNVLYLIIRVLN